MKTNSVKNWKNLNESNLIPQIINLKNLDLRSNRILSLSNGIFDKQATLTSLQLADNQLSFIPLGLFDTLIALTDLELDRNQLSSLPPGIFDKLVVLSELNLKNNTLSSLPSGLFKRLSALKTLNLLENHINVYPHEVFSFLPETLISFDRVTITCPIGTTTSRFMGRMYCEEVPEITSFKMKKASLILNRNNK